MPKLIRTKEDAEFAQMEIIDRREYLGCCKCDPQEWWDYAGRPNGEHCKSPLLPVIRTNPHGIREIYYEQCEVYRRWANQVAKMKKKDK